MERIIKPQMVLLRSNFQVIPNIYELPKLGAGHDGRVFRFNDKALKLLKYDFELRKEKNLMTFAKATYFLEQLSIKRISKPIDILLNEEGVYIGYVMEYLEDITNPKKEGTPLYRKPAEFSCGELINCISEFCEDFAQLTDNSVLASDINRGSYIFTTDFLHLCDMDKYQIGSGRVGDRNNCTLNYIFAKFLSSVMSSDLDKEQLKKLNYWVKKASNSRIFLESLVQEIGTDYRTPISEYAKYKVKKIM